MASWQCAIDNLVMWTYDSKVNLTSWRNGCELGKKIKIQSQLGNLVEQMICHKDAK